MAYKDITGLRSGKLTAIEPTDEKRKGSVLWRCLCDCGGEVLLEAYKITSGATKSCGCGRKGQRAKDLTGMRFGRLTALERLEEKSGSCYLWRCRCDCGNEVSATSNNLLKGNTTSCGCAKKEALKNNAADIKGRRFGMLTALRPLDKRSGGSVLWDCLCECGNHSEVPLTALVSGNTKSCGCLKTVHEQPPLHYIDGTCVELVLSDKIRSDNTSGCTGVYWRRNKWVAKIQYKGIIYSLGSFSKIEDAIKARKDAEVLVKDDAASLLANVRKPEGKRQHIHVGETQQYLR
ncbi:MAG: transcriptional regulator [Oscillospiraceae bacterium]|nr:transcriptional regulator [Oscillospiraceae bacterium]